MECTVTDLGNGAAKLALSGRMDITGALAADPVFARLAEEKSHLLVDMSDVSFLASLGIRTLVMSCKTLASRGGHFVLFGLQPSVDKVLRTSGLHTMIPIVPDLQAAEDLLRK
jgi:anti-sigma B factor antagonist